MNFEKLRNEIIRHEGVVNHAYQDHLGYWTIGVGRLIDERKGGGLSDDEVEYLLFNDLRRVQSALESRIDFWYELSDTQQRALCNMAFQLGVSGLLQFRKTLQLMREGMYKEASEEALNSRWARQTPNRARDVASMLTETRS